MRLPPESAVGGGGEVGENRTPWGRCSGAVSSEGSQWLSCSGLLRKEGCGVDP